MAQRVVAMDVRMVAAVADGSLNVAAFCREHGVSRQQFYEYRRRFQAEGLGGLQPRSRRPRSSPTATPPAVEEAIVRARKELADAGWDHGPDAVRDHLLDRGVAAPSTATVWKVLCRRGQIVPTPNKRPKSANHRFTFDRPNGCWQSDWTSFRLANGRPAAIAGTLDDHSRYYAGLRAGPGDGTSELVWDTMLAAIAECGIPAMSLTDNGRVYSGAKHGPASFTAAFEANLRALGVRTITSTPGHPQTCGKIERSWRTIKTYLAAQRKIRSVAELQDHLDIFREHYNHHRRHRGIGRRVPADVFAATPRERPAEHALDPPTIVTHTIVTAEGKLPAGAHDIAVGTAYRGRQLTLIRTGNHALVLDGKTTIRQLEINPNRRYQALTRD